MFCQQCGAELLNATKFCVKCGHRLKAEPRISNKAMLLAGFAALVSVGSATLSYWPRSSSIGTAAIATPTPTASVSLSPTPTPQIIVVRATPKPRQAPEEESEPEPTPKPYRPRLEPTPDYPFRHTPTLDSPVDDAVFSHFPRRLILHWTRNTASEAVKYRVTIQYGSPVQPFWWSAWQEIETTGEWFIEDMFVGAQPGRWRVTPIFSNGRSGIPTEWRTFRFTR